MTPLIFTYKLNENINNNTFNFLLQFVEQNKQIRINKIKNKTNKDLSLVGDIITRYAIKKVFGICFKDISIKIDKLGKPYVLDYPNIHFNISHSGNIVVCAIYDKPVGIDVQRMDDVNFDSIAKRFFTKSEQNIFFNVEEENKKEQFFKIWTSKESFIKFLGTGASSLDCDINKSCKVNPFYLDPNYMLCLCFEKK